MTTFLSHLLPFFVKTSHFVVTAVGELYVFIHSPMCYCAALNQFIFNVGPTESMLPNVEHCVCVVWALVYVRCLGQLNNLENDGVKINQTTYV